MLSARSVEANIYRTETIFSQRKLGVAHIAKPLVTGPVGNR
jgi:hypothetical protein